MTNASFQTGRTPASPLIRRAAGLLGVGLLVAACGGGGSTANPTFGVPSSGPASTPGAAGGGITATEADFKIDLSAASAPAGPVTFNVKNMGSQVHEFVVIKTDLMADALPKASGGTDVDEEASGLVVVDEVEDLAAGASQDLAVTLDAGHYVVICNVPGHYQLGMRADFNVGS